MGWVHPQIDKQQPRVSSDARNLKALEDENRKLKKLLAESMLDVATLREALGKNF